MAIIPKLHQELLRKLSTPDELEQQQIMFDTHQVQDIQLHILLVFDLHHLLYIALYKNLFRVFSSPDKDIHQGKHKEKERGQGDNQRPQKAIPALTYKQPLAIVEAQTK